MNYNQVHSLLSKASEAIVSQDGKVKRRLKNYETVIGEHGSDDPFYIPPGAVNDNYGNLNYVTSEDKSKNIHLRLSQLRYLMFGAFTLVIIVFAWSIYSFLLPTSTNSSDHQIASDPTDLLAVAVNEIQLERVANLIIRDDDWNEARMALLLKHWNASDNDAQESYKASAWFQHFSYRLENKLERVINTGELLERTTNAEKHPVLTLALTVGVADPNIDYVAKSTNSNDYEKLESAVATELAKMEQSKLAGAKNSDQVVVDEDVLSRLLIDRNGKPLLSGGDALKAPVAPSPKKDETQKELKPIVVAAAIPPAINEQDISRVFKKYASAYERGDFNEMSSLFGVNDPRKGDRIIEKLKANYENIFSNSSKRSVDFRGINWRFDGKNAIVNSDYKAKIELKNNKGTQTVTANAMVGLQKSKDQLKISSFELLNRSVSVVTPELNIPSATKKTRVRPKTPTPAELQDIVTRLVASYETGDINMFTELFSMDAKTNDRQNLAGITSDYSELFKGSNDRQMFIQGMQWKFDDLHAKGTGELEAIVLSETGQSVYTMTGKIQLVAQRINGKVRITHMYHIERAN